MPSDTPEVLAAQLRGHVMVRHHLWRQRRSPRLAARQWWQLRHRSQLADGTVVQCLQSLHQRSLWLSPSAHAVSSTMTDGLRFDAGRCARTILVCGLATCLGCGGKSGRAPDEVMSAGGQPGAAAGAANSWPTAGADNGSPGGTEAAGGTGGAAIVQAPTPCEGPCMDTGPRPTPLPRPICPLQEPQVGEACSVPDLLCSYGDAPTPRCRGYYQCENGSWTEDAALNNFPCLANADCPATAANVSQCTLENTGIPCAYPDQLCYCASGKNKQTGAPGYWNCYGAPVNQDCPATLPNIGEGCAEQGLECHYAVDGCTAPPHSTVFCRDGAWEDGEPLGCLG